MIAFLRKKDKFISLVLKHIDTSAMMDLLLRLISCVEPATLRQEVLNVRTRCVSPASLGDEGVVCSCPEETEFFLLLIMGASPLSWELSLRAGVAGLVALAPSAHSWLAWQKQPGSVPGCKGFLTRFFMQQPLLA